MTGIFKQEVVLSPQQSKDAGIIMHSASDCALTKPQKKDGAEKKQKQDTPKKIAAADGNHYHIHMKVQSQS